MNVAGRGRPPLLGGRLTNRLPVSCPKRRQQDPGLAPARNLKLSLLISASSAGKESILILANESPSVVPRDVAVPPRERKKALTSVSFLRTLLSAIVQDMPKGTKRSAARMNSQLTGICSAAMASVSAMVIGRNMVASF